MMLKKSCNLAELQIPPTGKIQLIHLNIFQSNDYKKNSDWLYFVIESGDQENQQVEHPQNIFFVTYSTFK